MPGGRPSDYRPEYCDQIVAICGEGASVTEFAHTIGVVTKTVYNWRDAHPEFLLAFTRARDACKTWWERQVRTSLHSRETNAKLIEFMMSNLFPEDYGNRQQIDVRVTGQVHVRSLPRQELERLAGQAIIDAEEVSEHGQKEPKQLGNGPDASTQPDMMPSKTIPNVD